MFKFGTYPLRLRFIIEGDEGGTEQVEEPVETAPAESAPVGPITGETFRPTC